VQLYIFSSFFYFTLIIGQSGRICQDDSATTLRSHRKSGKYSVKGHLFCMVQLYMYLLSVVAFHEKVITFFILLLQQFSYISYFCVQVGPADMFDIHQQLIELRKQEKELEVRSSVLLLLR